MAPRSSRRDGGVWVECKPVPVLGAWVLCEGTWDGERVINGAARSCRCRTACSRGPAVTFRARPMARGACATCARAPIVLRAIRASSISAFAEVERRSRCRALDRRASRRSRSSAPNRAGWHERVPDEAAARAGMPRIYQICRCFRRGELGQRHHPSSRCSSGISSFAGMREVMRDTDDRARRALGARRLDDHPGTAPRRRRAAVGAPHDARGLRSPRA